MNDRCKSTHYHLNAGELRCELKSGHLCAHFCGDYWWPNKNGLPDASHTNTVGYLLLGVVAILGAIMIWFLLR
jgi:hypothetical protein